MGWKGYEYIHHVSFHLEIKNDGKGWIHENRTDILIENELVEAGIDAKDIIAGMIEPNDENAKAA